MKNNFYPLRVINTRLLILFFALLLIALALIGTTAVLAKHEEKNGKQTKATQPLAANADPVIQAGEQGKAEALTIPSEKVIQQPFNYQAMVQREKTGDIPSQASLIPFSRKVTPNGPVTATIVNNNAGASGTANFTQSEATVVAFGTTVVVAFNDSGSNAGGTNKFTGFSRSTDGGVTFADGGILPTNPNGDVGDPVLARDETTGRVFLSTLQFANGGIDVFHSDDGGATWSAPAQGAPGKNSPPGNFTQDKSWIAVDNFGGAGNGNVYLIERDFGPGNGIFFFRSTDGGSTFGPSGGTLITSAANTQGGFVVVGPDHSVYAFWYAGTTLQVRKSIDLGATFAPAVHVASGLIGGTNGDLGLTGLRQGTGTFSGFRSNEFPHAAVNPVSGNLYVTYNNRGAGTDKADVFLVQSTDGGATWSAPLKVNDDVTTTDQWQPTLAVSTDGSRLGIFYYSRQEDPAINNLFKYYARTAVISGSTLTFAPSFAVSGVASLPEFGRDSVVNSTYMGDYNTAFASPGFFHVVWSDNRDDLPGGAPRKDPNVYYATIPLGLSVTSTVPAVGSVVSSQPTSFTVNVTDPVDPATLQASDFTVNGIPANSVSYTAGTTTMTFGFTSTPVTAQGLQTMSIAGGAFTRASDANPVVAFNGTFRYDAVLLQVVSTNPPVNGVFTLPGPFTYDVNFNEPVDPTSVQTTDLVLTGAGSSVTGVTVLPGNTTARFTINASTEGALTANIAAGAITDQFGNPGAAFSGSYQVDIGTIPYPAAPLTGKNPPGSLIYDPSASGTINFAGDNDGFTLAIDPGQTITVLVTAQSPGLQPSVTLRDPASTVIGSATAAAAGQNALIQTASTTTGGTYTVVVTGASSTTGNYTVQIILNAAQEFEGTLVGVTNNTLATAQNIDGSFITVQTSQGSAQRGAVSGTTDNAGYTGSAVPFTFEDISATGTVITGLDATDDTSVSIPIGFTFPYFGSNNTTIFVSSNGLLSFGVADTTFTNTDLTATPNEAAIAPFWDDQQIVGGANTHVYFQVLGSGPNQHLTIQYNNVSFFADATHTGGLTYEAQLFADGRIQFNYQNLVTGNNGGSNENGASATVGIKDAGTQGPNRLLLAFNNGPNGFVGTGRSTLLTPPNPTPDFYSFTMAAGDVTTLAAKASGTLGLDLLNSGGSVIATGVGGPTNLDSVINGFVIPSSGTYYARITGGGGASNVAYNLVVTRNAAFDNEPNDSFATAQPIDGNRGALGAIKGTGVYQATAVPFTFEDISGTGTVITGLNAADDTSVSIPIGFTFPFFGSNNTTIFVSSNGLLSFGVQDTTFTNTDLTTTPSEAAIAPFWDDQDIVGGANTHVYFQVVGSGPNQHLTIQFNNVSFFADSTKAGGLTYEAQLFADGRIQFNYQNLATGNNGAANDNGVSATVGIKAPGVQGPNRLLLAFNNGPNAFVGSGKSTLISQPGSDDWYSITLSGSQTALRVETATPADGPGEFVNTLNPHIELYSPANVLLASGTTLADGRNESLTRSGLAPGPYRVRITSEGSTSGEYFVSVNVGAAPVVTCPANFSVNSDPNQCGAVVNFTGAHAASATGNPAPTITYSPVSGSVLTAGTNTVTATATNVFGTSSCTFVVTVVDQPPTITCPGTITKFSDPGQLGAFINPGTPVAVDDCPGVSVTGVRSDGKPLNALYPIGVTMITWTAKDSTNHTATCVQTIVVMLPSEGHKRRP